MNRKNYAFQDLFVSSGIFDNGQFKNLKIVKFDNIILIL